MISSHVLTPCFPWGILVFSALRARNGRNAQASATMPTHSIPRLWPFPVSVLADGRVVRNRPPRQPYPPKTPKTAGLPPARW